MEPRCSAATAPPVPAARQQQRQQQVNGRGAGEGAGKGTQVGCAARRQDQRSGRLCRSVWETSAACGRGCLCAMRRASRPTRRRSTDRRRAAGKQRTLGDITGNAATRQNFCTQPLTGNNAHASQRDLYSGHGSRARFHAAVRCTRVSPVARIPERCATMTSRRNRPAFSFGIDPLGSRERERGGGRGQVLHFSEFRNCGEAVGAFDRTPCYPSICDYRAADSIERSSRHFAKAMRDGIIRWSAL